MSLVWVFVVPGYFIPGSYDQAKLSIVKRLAWYWLGSLSGLTLPLFLLGFCDCFGRTCCTVDYGLLTRGV